MVKKITVFVVVVFFLFNCTMEGISISPKRGLLPWIKNNFYWQYKGKPLLLLGASSDDNLYQWPVEKLRPHLDSMKLVGANYIRNTMSDRDKENIRAFAKTAEGKYDLTKWNNEYWNRFENMLKETHKRDIIVQIELWDRFDHSRSEWEGDPYNPKNNINYTYKESGFDKNYPNHPGSNKQPFFFTIPRLNNNTNVLKYQQAFVNKVLSVVANYKNVLICLDNETSGTEEWASYWEEFIHSYTKDIHVTEMWDNWDIKSEIHKRTIDHPERYSFIDISQNSHNKGAENWENAQYIFDYIKDNPRPVNSTKIYGNDKGKFSKRGIDTQHGINTFCRNILGGFASSRFHRPTSGQGLNEISMNCIASVRKIEEEVKMWEIEPHLELLKPDDNTEAYVSAKPGEKYVVYFANGGKAKLDLSKLHGTFNLQWINTENAEWRSKTEIKGGLAIELDSKCDKSCFAVLTIK